ncbi:MAG: hypothetical protein ACU0BB_05045 [Paracoccaceae bacterium]
MRTAFLAGTLGLVGGMPAAAQDKPMNYLIIWCDDVGYWNVSA